MLFMGFFDNSVHSFGGVSCSVASLGLLDALVNTVTVEDAV